MWTSIYVANDETQARSLQMNLESEGILAKVHPIQTKSKSKTCQYEVQVPESEVEEAQAVLCGK